VRVGRKRYNSMWALDWKWTRLSYCCKTLKCRFSVNQSTHFNSRSGKGYFPWIYHLVHNCRKIYKLRPHVKSPLPNFHRPWLIRLAYSVHSFLNFMWGMWGPSYSCHPIEHGPQQILNVRGLYSPTLQIPGRFRN
jgi:hypothetical protein